MEPRVSTALKALAHALLTAEQTPDFYRRALEHVCALVPGAVRGSVLERRGDAFERLATAGPDAGADPPSAARIPARAVLSAIDDASDASDVSDAATIEASGEPQGAAAREARPWLAVPITAAGDVSAVMWLEGRVGQADFGEDARELAAALGHHIGALLQRLRWEQRIAAALGELEVQAELRGALARASEVEEVIRLAVEGIARLQGGRPSAGYLIDGDEAVLLHQVGCDGAAERIPLDRGSIGRVARLGQPVLIDDHAPEQESPWASMPVRAMIGVPLVDSRVMGVLAVASSELDLDERDVERLSSVAQYVTVALQRAELLASLRVSERRFRLLTEHMGELVCLVEGGRLTYVSPSSEALLGQAPESLLGGELSAHVESEDALHLEVAIRAAIASGGPAAPVTVRARHREGHRVWLETTVAPISSEGAIDGVVTVSRDVSERQAFEAQLLGKALYDDLTGLPNRALLLDRLRQACERRRRDGSTRCALLFVDLDRFKQVNDSLGHAAGDELLRAVASRFEELTRGADTVARLGGDEFCLLLEDVSDHQAALEAAGRVRAALREPFVVRRRELYLSASIGIAIGDEVWSDAEADAEAMLRDADIAMYRAKQRGSVGEVVFDVDMRNEVKQRLELENELHRALEHGQLWLAYQPIVRLEDGSLEAFEALLRWDHPTRGLLEPDAFVPLAEGTGLIRPLDRWALRTACAQLAHWRAGGADGTRVSVNVSARHAVYGGLETLVREALGQAGLPAAALTLEITESALMDDRAQVARELERLRAEGVRILIDDFGTGYSSLGALQRLPIDALKVDRGFLENIEHSRSQQAIVSATVRLADTLGIPVVAEGIETEQQHAFVRDLGCAMAQGFFLGAPLPPERLDDRWWSSRRG